MQPDLPGIQHGTSGDPAQRDDDMLQPGIQIAPLLDDLPEPRQVEHWLVVNLEGGIERVVTARIAIHDPDERLYAERQMEARSCGDLAAALAVAVETGQLSPEAAAQIALCDGSAMAVFRLVLDLPVSAMAGQYRVEGLVIDANGAGDTVSTVFESLPVLGLDISSDLVSFGEVAPGEWYDARAAYSVRNTGNVAGYVYLEFSAMVGSVSGQVITEFGVLSGAEQLMPIASDERVCFSQQLAPGEQRDLILSVRPGTVPPDEYAGKLALGIRARCDP